MEPQRTKPIGHDVWQVPLEQMPVAPHEVPQVPQLAGSMVRLTQMPLHSVRPGAQAQAPLTQEPSPHEVPQLPQFAGSFCVLTQRPLHSVLPIGHWHVPEIHDAPAAQPTPHMPQLVTSFCVLTHWFPQRVVPMGHWQTPA
jgi:hypothetical protein